MIKVSNIYYMITIQCIERCSKCSHWKQKDTSSRLSPKLIITTVNYLPDVTEFCIVGGEPLMFKNELFEILDGISIRKVRTTIITNGVLMNPEFINQIKNYNIHLVVSIDTVDPKFWKFVRGSNSYKRVMDNFEYAVEVLTGEKISVQSVLSKETEPHIEYVRDLCDKHNIYHSVQDYISDGFNGSWTPLEKEHITRYPGQQCFSANRNLSIVQNGDVYTCFQQNWIHGCRKPIGNLNDNSITDIISSDYAVEVTSKMMECNLPCKVLKCNIE